MRVIPIPIFENNYSYLIVDDKANEAAAVDPAEPHKVLAVLAQTGAKLTSILTTHHHQKHSVGNIELVLTKPNLAVYGADARIPELNYVCKHNEEFTVGTLKVRSFHTPSHTKGSVCYYVRDGNEMNEEMEKALFTGDTLLTGGCGKFIEGDAKDMYNVLYNILGQLPKDTKVYCGHECGLHNLQFASTVDPTNQYLRKKLAFLQMNQMNQNSVPSTLEEEFEYNPYLRLSDTSIQQATNVSDPYEVMNMLRVLNDSFNNQSNGLNGLSHGMNETHGTNGITNGLTNGLTNGVNGVNGVNGLTEIFDSYIKMNIYGEDDLSTLNTIIRRRG